MVARTFSPTDKEPVMTTQDTRAFAGSTAPAGSGSTLTVAAICFPLLYLAADVVSPNLASSALPLPDAPLAQSRAWFADNQLAAAMLGVAQVLSVSALAVFVIRLRKLTPSASRWAPWGLAAVALMVVASVSMWLLAALAPGASLDVVSVLRTGNFVAGGTAHVLALGVFVTLVSRLPETSRPVRMFGYVAAVPAVLSVVSLVWFQGAALILLGRLLCMAWVVSAAVSVTRRVADDRDHA
jgi:hypothetical protein